MANFDINKLVMESVMDLQEAANPSEQRATAQQRFVTTDKDESNRPKVNTTPNPSEQRAAGFVSTDKDESNIGDEEKKGLVKRAINYAKENPGKATGAAAAALGAGLGGVALARRLRNRRKS